VPGPVLCVRCGGEAGISAIPVRPHAVWLCRSCHAALLAVGIRLPRTVP
jgi:hypothetical protein